MVRESSAVAMARAKKVEQEMVESGLLPPPAPPAPVLPLKDNPRDSLTSIASRNSASAKTNPATEAEEAVRVRLEAIGMHVGAFYGEVRVELCYEPICAEILPQTLLGKDAFLRNARCCQVYLQGHLDRLLGQAS